MSLVLVILAAPQEREVCVLVGKVCVRVRGGPTLV